ncbi:hypothetical protein OH687_30295 [Burkholderia anthina]|nr:hypothetical protein OH687_30295 [Burkholderia anthina]
MRDSGGAERARRRAIEPWPRDASRIGMSDSPARPRDAAADSARYRHASLNW